MFVHVMSIDWAEVKEERTVPLFLSLSPPFHIPFEGDYRALSPLFDSIIRTFLVLSRAISVSESRSIWSTFTACSGHSSGRTVLSTPLFHFRMSLLIPRLIKFSRVSQSSKCACLNKLVTRPLHTYVRIGLNHCHVFPLRKKR